MSRAFASFEEVMQRALELARQGEGFVEPNPMVGAVLVDDRRQLLGEGWHERFGGPHAEINALTQAGPAVKGATLVITLEPCCHEGKTPPCVDALLRAGVSRVIVGMQDPFPQVAGQGIARLRAAGVQVEVGLLAGAAQALTAPFCRLVATGMPWVHAKWAMTLDGKLASRTGHSQWISNGSSRQVVHRLRGKMDAIVVGVGTAVSDDPLLTARPPGARVATRIVVDPTARLPVDSQLLRTARDFPLLVAVGSDAQGDRPAALREAGAEVLALPRSADGSVLDLGALLADLGRRRCTNVLVEGGSATLGAFFDAGLVDEVHAFVAPKLLGGSTAPSPIGGTGRSLVPELASLTDVAVENLDGDLYIRGRVRRE